MVLNEYFDAKPCYHRFNFLVILDELMFLFDFCKFCNFAVERWMGEGGRGKHKFNGNNISCVTHACSVHLHPSHKLISHYTHCIGIPKNSLCAELAMIRHNTNDLSQATAGSKRVESNASIKNKPYFHKGGRGKKKNKRPSYAVP